MFFTSQLKHKIYPRYNQIDVGFVEPVALWIYSNVVRIVDAIDHDFDGLIHT